MRGETLDVVPRGDCNCPTNYPVLIRQPHFPLVEWYGDICKSIDMVTERYRVPLSTHHRQFITDNNTESFWMSDGQKLNKFTIDLKTKYNVRPLLPIIFQKGFELDQLWRALVHRSLIKNW